MRCHVCSEDLSFEAARVQRLAEEAAQAGSPTLDSLTITCPACESVYQIDESRASWRLKFEGGKLFGNVTDCIFSDPEIQRILSDPECIERMWEHEGDPDIEMPPWPQVWPEEDVQRKRGDDAKDEGPPTAPREPEPG